MAPTVHVGRCAQRTACESVSCTSARWITDLAGGKQVAEEEPPEEQVPCLEMVAQLDNLWMEHRVVLIHSLDYFAGGIKVSQRKVLKVAPTHPSWPDSLCAPEMIDLGCRFTRGT